MTLFPMLVLPNCILVYFSAACTVYSYMCMCVCVCVGLTMLLCCYL